MSKFIQATIATFLVSSLDFVAAEKPAECFADNTLYYEDAGKNAIVDDSTRLDGLTDEHVIAEMRACYLGAYGVMGLEVTWNTPAGDDPVLR